MLRTSLPLSAAALAGVLAACPALRGPQAEAEQPPAAVAESRDSLAGWFHVVWGNGAHYLLVTGSGEAVELLLEPAVREAIGDPLLLDRQPVTVLGQRLPPPGKEMRVFDLRTTPPL